MDKEREPRMVDALKEKNRAKMASAEKIMNIFAVPNGKVPYAPKGTVSPEQNKVRNEQKRNEGQRKDLCLTKKLGQNSGQVNGKNSKGTLLLWGSKSKASDCLEGNGDEDFEIQDIDGLADVV